MLYEIRIKKPDGTLKKVISAEEVDKIYWKQFYESENSIGLVTSPKAKVPNWVKQRLDLVFPDAYEIARFAN